MKITIDLKGATPAAPDYDMLKAALCAAQAATPTARISHDAAVAGVDPRDALHALFAGEGGVDQPAQALGNSFRRGPSDPSSRP